MALPTAADLLKSPAQTIAAPTQAAPQSGALPTAESLLGTSAPGVLPPTSLLPPKQEGPAGFFDGVKYGAKEAAMPFNVDKGEQTRALSSGASTAGYLLSNIATSLGMNAALTAATGGAAGALGAARQAATAKNIATGLYALYQGLGRDRIRTREEGKRWDPMSKTALLSAGLELNPLMKASGPLSRTLTRVAAQGAGEAALEGMHGGDAKDMGIAAALGIVGAGIPLAMTAKGGPAQVAVGKAAAEDMLQALDTSDTPELYTKAQAKLQSLGTARPEEPTTEFMRFVVGDKDSKMKPDVLEKAFSAVSSKLGPKKLDERFVLMQTEKAMGEAAGEINLDNLKKLNAEIDEPNVVKRTLMPMFYVSREIDKRTGMNTSAIVDKMAQAHNRHNTISKHFTDRFVTLQDRAKKMGLSGQDVTHIVTQESEKELERLTKKHGQAQLDTFRKDMQEAISGKTGLLGYLKEVGYNPTFRQNYMPAKAVSSPKLASILQGQLEQLPAALEGRTIADVRRSLEKAKAAAQGGEKGAIEALKAKDKAASIIDILDKTAERVDVKPLKEISDWGTLKDKLLSGARWAEHSDELPESVTEMSALFARRGDVPGLVRETDAWKLLSGYINENLRAAHFEDALNYGRMYAGILNKIGMKKTAELFDNYLKDQAGGARGLAGVMRKLNTKLEFTGAEKIRKAANAFDVSLGKTIGAMPEFASWLNSQVYTSKLALNVPGIIRNATQWAFTTVPELGHGYGFNKAFAAARGIASDLKSNPKKLSAMYRQMEEKGLLSQHGRLEASEFAQAFGGVKGKIDKFNSGGGKIPFTEKEWPGLFVAYAATDKFNRALTWRMGREVAADVLADTPAARRFAESLDTGTKQELKRLLKSPLGGKEKLDAVHDLIGRYLISKTQFDYSAANKAEWARMVGPYFSMFTTWPGMIASDIAHTMSSRGFAQGGKKLLSKYLPLYGLMQLASESLSDSDDSMHQKYWIAEPTSFSPLDAVIPKPAPMPGRGGILSNPLSQAGAKLGAGLASDAASAASFVASGGEEGSLIPRKTGRAVLTDVIPTYAPIIAPFLNELDRWTRIKEGTKKTSQVADELGLNGGEE